MFGTRMSSEQKRKRKRKAFSWLMVLCMVMTMFSTQFAAAAVGDTPAHTKTIHNNGDGTYTISLDVVGDSEKQPNNVNVIVIFDRSGSMTSQRMNAAKNAVNNLANALFAYNTQSSPDTVEMALVSFSTNATITRQPTTSYAQFSQSVNSLTANGGTNWEDALDEAGNVNFGVGDDDQTFVIFVSDGNPTFRDTRITTEYLPQSDNDQWSDWYGRATQEYYTYRGDQLQGYSVYGLGSDNPNNANYSPTSMNRCYEAALPEAQAIVQNVGGDHFFTIGAYGDVSRMQTLTTAAGAPAGNFYNANDTAALNKALSDILAKIEMMGIGNTSIDDGTTNQVKATSGEVAELLEVDTDSFKYYRSGGTYGNMQEWADAPEATFENGSVNWDLESEGVLENGVKYTVTFDCYPSQTTYDIIAQLENGDIEYGERIEGLPSEIWNYIVKNQGGGYSLLTNTNATLSYNDTRDEAGQKEVGYTNPPPVATDAETLKASKEWEGGNPDVDELDITVLMDDKPFHTATISDDNDWATESFISIGIIKNGKVLPGAEGHDFKFAELGNEQYHWELESPVVHPMLIDGTKTMLIQVDATHKAPAGADTYTINGKEYYADTSAAGLTAINHRRSNLNLTKAVTGEDAPKDAKFPFEMTVNNSKAPEEEPSAQDDPKHESDYWVWLSIRDEKGQGVTGLNLGSGVVEDSGGYYYAPSGTTFSAEIGAGWSLRFLNLPTGTTYTFKESLPTGSNFAFKSAELTAGADSTFSGGQTTTGKIENVSTSYYVTYTNDYQLTDLEITKVWEDNGDQDGIRPTAEEFKEYLVLKADGTDVTEANADKLEVTENEDGTYTAKWTGLDRYADGEEIAYTVEETEITGYDTEGSPANDKGTITNSHTPAVIDIPVEKVWDDADNQDGKRPSSVTVQLKAGNENVGDAVTLNEANQWKHTWTNLPEKKAGTAIAYKVVETSAPAGYEAEVTGDAATGFTVTNSYTPETTTATVTKAWDDADDQDGMRPESIVVVLSNGTEVTLPGEDGSWTATVRGLPKYANGQEIEYTWTEKEVPDGYTVDYGEGRTNAANGGTITNKHTPEVTEATVKKVWDDNENQDGVRPGSVEVTLSNGTKVTLSETNNWTQTVSGLPKYADGEEITYSWTETVPAGYTVSGNSTEGTVTTITNTHTPSTIDISGTKTWDDADDQDGYRPDSITVNLLANGEKVDSKTVTAPWTYEFTGVPEYANGQKITYTVSEEAVDKYNPTYTGYDIKNTHVPEVVDVSVEKKWDDADDQDGKRPASVTVNLLADGEQVDTVTLNANNNWKHTFSNLPKNAEGEPISYTVEEEAVEYYTPTITPADGTDESSEGTADGGEATEEPAATGYIITNVHEPEKISIDVTKTWDDKDDQDGKRPGSITFNLLADGTKVASASVTADVDWAYKFEDLPKYSKGKEIEYTVTEDAVTDYTTTVNGYAVINKHTPEKTSVSVKKVWDDADNRDKIRPDSVTVNLLANGEAAGTATLSESNNWTYTFSGLDKYSKGQQITYTVAEEDVAEYEVEVTGTAAVGYTLKNYHQAKPDKVMSDPPVQKVVTGKPDTPATFTFQMKALTDGAPMPEGSKDGVKTIQIKGSGSDEFGEMYYEEAGEWVYEISEIDDGIEGYTYDGTVYTLTVKVEEVADGTQVKLVKTETIEGGDGSIVFTNEYNAPAPTPEPTPKTGDTAMTSVALLGLLASATLLALLRTRRKAER